MIHKLAAIILTGALGIYSSYKLGEKAQREGFGVQPSSPKTVSLEQLKEANPNLQITPLTEEKEVIIPTIIEEKQSSFFNWIDGYFDTLITNKINLLLVRIRGKFLDLIAEIFNNIIPTEYFIYIYWFFIIVFIYFTLKMLVFFVKIFILEVKWLLLGLKKVVNFFGYNIIKKQKQSINQKNTSLSLTRTIIIRKPKDRRFRSKY